MNTNLLSGEEPRNEKLVQLQSILDSTISSEPKFVLEVKIADDSFLSPTSHILNIFGGGDIRFKRLGAVPNLRRRRLHIQNFLQKGDNRLPTLDVSVINLCRCKEQFSCSFSILFGFIDHIRKSQQRLFEFSEGFMTGGLLLSNGRPL